MTPVVGGRHCASCSHIVVDFTGQTDEQIAAFLDERKDERVCGRMRTDQLRPPTRRAKRERTLWSQIRRFAAVVIVSLGLSSSRATAQESTPSPSSHVVPAIPLPVLSSTPTSADTLRGRVVDDETGKGLFFATVWVSGTDINTTTRSDGSFVLPLDQLLYRLRQHLCTRDCRPLQSAAADCPHQRREPAGRVSPSRQTGTIQDCDRAGSTSPIGFDRNVIQPGARRLASLRNGYPTDGVSALAASAVVSRDSIHWSSAGRKTSAAKTVVPMPRTAS